MARPKTRASQRKTQNSFPIWLVVAGVLILLSIAAWALLKRGGDKTNIEVTGAPGIKVDQEVFDYGDVKLGEKPIRTVVRVTNVGDQTLQITEKPYVEVLEGCWPPTPAVGSMAIGPGESTTITMEFFMHGAMGGTHNFQLHIPTNDPDEPDKTVSIISNWIE